MSVRCHTQVCGQISCDTTRTTFVRGRHRPCPTPRNDRRGDLFSAEETGAMFVGSLDASVLAVLVAAFSSMSAATMWCFDLRLRTRLGLLRRSLWLHRLRRRSGTLLLHRLLLDGPLLLHRLLLDRPLLHRVGTLFPDLAWLSGASLLFQATLLLTHSALLLVHSALLLFHGTLLLLRGVGLLGRVRSLRLDGL